MAKRAITKDIWWTSLLGLLFVVLFWLFNGVNHVSAYLSFGLFGFGVILGSVISFFISRKTLAVIEENGEFTGFKIHWLLTIAIVGIIVVTPFLVMYYFRSQFGILAINFMLPTVLALIIVQPLTFWRWERKNKKVLYSDYKQIYPYPYITPKVS
jgi:hypothetical protein